MTAERHVDATREVVVRILGDVASFHAELMAEVGRLGIDLAVFPLGHVAYRSPSLEVYLEQRDTLETVCAASVENEWHGRPIAKLLLAPPLPLRTHQLELIELIAPPHREGDAMGLDHLGFVVGPDLDAFGRRHAAVISGRQDQGPYNQPLYIRLASGRLVKFHERSLREVTELEGRRFDGFHHA